jgi:hypothetical protein
MVHGTHLYTSHYNYHSCFSSLHIFHSSWQAGCPLLLLSVTISVLVMWSQQLPGHPLSQTSPNKWRNQDGSWESSGKAGEFSLWCTAVSLCHWKALLSSQNLTTDFFTLNVFGCCTLFLTSTILPQWVLKCDNLCLLFLLRWLATRSYRVKYGSWHQKSV